MARDLIASSDELLERIWRPGYRYKKAAVMLIDLKPETPQQTHLSMPMTRADAHS